MERLNGAYKDLPKRWKLKIAEYLKSKKTKNRVVFYCSDFEYCVKIKFEDGSYAKFNSCIVIKYPECREIGIFTEHCGYFILSEDGVKIKYLY